MKNALALTNKNFVVFYEIHEKEKALQKRKSDSRLKYARIVEILQALPSKIENEKVYLRRI